MASEEKVSCFDCAVRRVSLFAEVPDASLKQVAFQPMVETYKAGETIIQPHSDDKAIYTIRKGVVKLERAASMSQRRIVRLLKAGDTLGLHSLHSGSHPHKVVALDDVELCRIPHEVIHHVDRDTRALNQTLLKRFTEDSQQADMWITHFSSGAVTRRMANFLIYLAEIQTNTPPEQVTLLNRDDMAAALGVRQESISRTITQFKSEGLIRPLSRDNYELDQESLRKYCLK